MIPFARCACNSTPSSASIKAFAKRLLSRYDAPRRSPSIVLATYARHAGRKRRQERTRRAGRGQAQLFLLARCRHEAQPVDSRQAMQHQRRTVVRGGELHRPVPAVERLADIQDPAIDSRRGACHRCRCRCFTIKATCQAIADPSCTVATCVCTSTARLLGRASARRRSSARQRPTAIQHWRSQIDF